MLFGDPDDAMHSGCTNPTSTECGNIRESLMDSRQGIRIMPKNNEQSALNWPAARPAYRVNEASER